MFPSMAHAAAGEPAFTPADAAALLAEADAAWQRSKAAGLPRSWLATVKKGRGQAKAVREAVEACAARDPQRWTAELMQGGILSQLLSTAPTLEGQETAMPRCDGCQVGRSHEVALSAVCDKAMPSLLPVSGNPSPCGPPASSPAQPLPVLCP